MLVFYNNKLKSKVMHFVNYPTLCLFRELTSKFDGSLCCHNWTTTDDKDLFQLKEYSTASKTQDQSASRMDG